jgi:hypothetical protein
MVLLQSYTGTTNAVLTAVRPCVSRPWSHGVGPEESLHIADFESKRPQLRKRLQERQIVVPTGHSTPRPHASTPSVHLPPPPREGESSPLPLCNSDRCKVGQASQPDIHITSRSVSHCDRRLARARRAQPPPCFAGPSHRTPPPFLRFSAAGCGTGPLLVASAHC